MNRFLITAVAAATLLIHGAAFAGDPNAAKMYVDSLASQVIALNKSEGNKADKQAKIEALFSDKVDINFVAKFVLGKFWRTATPQQQQDYVAAYKPYVLKNFANRLTKYSGQTYSLKPGHAEDDVVVVPMTINDPQGQDVNVEYRLREDAGAYKIIDIVVEGVSLLSTQRSEFSGIAESKGVDGLTEALKKQVASKAANS